MSERYAVIGQPVAHSKSPWIHGRFARETRQDIDYGLIEAPLAGFARAADEFRAGGGKGLNVTLPFKEDAFRYCAKLSPRARTAGAVNTVTFGPEVAGDNTDGIGLVRDLSGNLGVDLRGSRVLLMGAGGAAQGALGALLEAGVAAATIANRNVARARELAARFSVAARGYGELEGGFDLVINATSAGLSDEAPALPPGVLEGVKLAYDMVYGRDTPFLAAARAAGVNACDGLGMLVEQAAESFFVWRRVRPDTAAVLRELRGR
ncbi:MAG TPA: shikimate dehydrogenase [Burkholderiales bacterium]|nr:shikimate dehydrogenase [Burkholderiales bacterium]